MRRSIRRLGIIAGLCAGLSSACAEPTGAVGASRRPTPANPKKCMKDELGPSRAGFLHELLLARPSRRTRRFDAYTRGSYHVDKWEVAHGLPEQAALCAVRLRAVLVIGRHVPISTAYVVAVMDEGSQLRVNTLVMSNARVMWKGTQLASTGQVSVLLSAIRNAPFVLPGVPFQNGIVDDYSYGLLLATYGDGAAEYSHATFDEPIADPRV